MGRKVFIKPALHVGSDFVWECTNVQVEKALKLNLEFSEESISITHQRGWSTK